MSNAIDSTDNVVQSSLTPHSHIKTPATESSAARGLGFTLKSTGSPGKKER
jgi:hypothetical protein